MNNFFLKAKKVGKSTLILLVIAIFMVGLSILVFTRIKVLRADVVKAKSERDKLSQRVETLRGMEPEISSSSTQTVYNALPSVSSPLVAATQIKMLASSLEVSVNNLQIFSSPGEQKEVNSYEIYFTVEGKPEDVFTFISTLSKLTPLINLYETKISESGGLLKGELKSASYWAPFTASLPSISEPIHALSDEEKSIINQLLDFKAPSSASSSLSPNFPSESRPDPFTVGLSTLPQ